MIDHNFFEYKGPLPLSAILSLTDIKEVRYGQGVTKDTSVGGIARLDEAQATHLAMLHNKKYISQLQSTHAGFCFVEPDMVQHCPETTTALITRSPYRCFGIVADAFYPHHESRFSIQETAIHPTAKIGENCVIEYGAVIQANAEIGSGTKIGANAVIGPRVKIGKNCLISAGVRICFSIIGDHVVIYQGTCIGQSGFGFFMDEKGHVKVPQLGRVIIEDHVEIGANTTIDRGSMDDTVIGKGSRIDNLVQIAHNVRLGQGCVIVAQVGISGSTRMVNYVIAAGQAGITGHLNIGSRAKIAAQSGVMRDILEGEAVAGSPAVPVKQWHRQTISLAHMVSATKKRGSQ